MKTTFFTAALVIALGSSIALASDKDAKPTKATAEGTTAKEKPQVAPKKEKVALTGSYIKRDIRRNGQITDGPSPVAVLDSKTIQNSGAADLRQLLMRQGVSH